MVTGVYPLGKNTNVLLCSNCGASIFLSFFWECIYWDTFCPYTLKKKHNYEMVKVSSSHGLNLLGEWLDFKLKRR